MADTLPPAAGARTVPAGRILATIVALVGADAVLLPCFLGLPWAIPLVLLLPLALLVRAAAGGTAGEVPLRRLAACTALAVALLMLGGEGRLFYANIDWQVRDAVLADMIRLPWPFVYAGDGAGPLLLRAPLGMYLLPALAGKAGGAALADAVLLMRNAVLLGGMLAIGSGLVPPAARRIVAVVVILFSGMDAVGVALFRQDLLWPPFRHIDDWAHLQYSSTITLAFWVPQHALAGWAGALAFLLWRAGRLPLGLLLAMAPLWLLWSPLGVMGMLPFVAFAAVRTLASGRMRAADVALPAAALALAAVPILFLKADAGSVGWRPAPVDPLAYAAVILLEVLPVLGLSALLLRGRPESDRATALIVAVCLLLFPFLQIGQNVDFMMRASIAPLAIAALHAGVAIAAPVDARGRRYHRLLAAVLLVGAVTPVQELGRALAYRPAPRPACDLAMAWDQSFAMYGKATYFARLPQVSALIRPARPTLAPPLHPAACWTRPWQVARFG